MKDNTTKLAWEAYRQTQSYTLLLVAINVIEYTLLYKWLV